jgi:PKD repeat protein
VFRLSVIAGALVVILGLAAAPPASAAHLAPAAARPARATAPDAGALIQAYAAGRHLPAGSVAGIRPGSLHSATAAGSGVSWAIADFRPARTAGALAQDGFQDGASTAVFRRVPGQSWRLAPASGGPYGCGRALPAAVRAAWQLTAPAGCRATPAAQRRAAARARPSARAGGPAPAASPVPSGSAIASIALGQVGVSDTPPVTSFSGVDCDPYTTIVAAQSPNADGCGFDQALTVQNENEPWCSDFAKWVWQQAGVTAGMGIINAGADSFYGWGASQGEALPVDSGTPAPGDAVVFYPPGPVSATAYADHVGIISAVHPDGTVDLVNGDFLGAANISVQYNTGVSLTSWASQVWNAGEQWVLVVPPASAQQPAPAAAITGPRSAVAGTAVALTAHAAQPGGSVTQIQWTFGDGRDTNATGGTVRHVFAGAGLYPVTVTATSSAGTVTTRTRDIDVVATGSAVASAPSTAVWYSAIPVSQLLFLPPAGGALAAESSDGESWLRQALPGQAAAGSPVTALNYPDATGTVQPHVYYRAADGGLGETYRSGGTWAADLAGGDPAPGSQIVATTAPGSLPGSATAEVFYAGPAGQLTETAGAGAARTTSTLAGLPAASGGSVALTDVAGPGGTARELLFYLSARGSLLAASPVIQNGAGRRWQAGLVRSGAGVAAGSPLAAVTTGADGSRPMVFFLDRRGHLAAAARRQPGPGWIVQELPGTPAPESLTATAVTLPSGALAPEVFYRTAAGTAGVTAWDGQQWQASALPGTAASVLGAAGYPAAAQPEQVFTGTGAAPALESSADSGRTWTATTLPAAVATFADTVLLYAATAADDSAALSAAAAAGLPAGQVTQSYATAWAAALSGDYLVIAVGPAAADALYFNACGWPDPSGEIAGSTPFYIAAGPLGRLPGADAYENATAATAAQSPQRAADLAYYATHGQLPAGVSALPAAASPQYTCSGAPSAAP